VEFAFTRKCKLIGRGEWNGWVKGKCTEIEESKNQELKLELDKSLVPLDF
jgi:hypothetical protein